MAKYLIEETLTGQSAVGMMENPEDRNEALRPIFKAAGCKLEQFYVSAIENKSYLIVESPDLDSVFTVGATFLAGGTAQAIKYTPLLTLPETVTLFKKAATLGFRPPGK
jgi:uncharacterized protein with GYD domain